MVGWEARRAQNGARRAQSTNPTLEPQGLERKTDPSWTLGSKRGQIPENRDLAKSF